MTIKSLTLLTADITTTKLFYHNTLGFKIIDQSDHQISFQVGVSVLQFQLTNTIQNPTYHFAFNIPENQIEQAKDWLSARVSLEKDAENNELIDFSNWNAHAIYFYDSLGNIVEFIARHGLDNASQQPFSIQNIINISEIGLPSDDVIDLVQTIQTHSNLPNYLSGSDKFYTIGDENGLFVIVPTDRVWYMTKELKSTMFPTWVEVKEIESEFKYGEYVFS